MDGNTLMDKLLHVAFVELSLLGIVMVAYAGMQTYRVWQRRGYLISVILWPFIGLLGVLTFISGFLIGFLRSEIAEMSIELSELNQPLVITGLVLGTVLFLAGIIAERSSMSKPDLNESTEQP